MSAELLITTIEKLYKLHRSLYEMAVKKTEIIKVGDIESLQNMVKEENAHISAIRKLEDVRQKSTIAICQDRENPTISDCIEKFNGPEKDTLIKISEQLTETILDLKEQNYLNQQLIHQSLQFVNMSLNLLRPQPNSINYGPPTQKKTNSTSGFYNSQA